MCINGVKKVNVFLPVCSKFNLLSEMGLSTLHNCFVSCSLDFEIITLVLQSSSYSTCFWGPTTAFLLLLFIYVLTIIEYLFIRTIYYLSKSVFFLEPVYSRIGSNLGSSQQNLNPQPIYSQSIYSQPNPYSSSQPSNQPSLASQVVAYHFCQVSL